jgi:sporulation protein YlmC with PRC-barrel domain
MDIPVHAEVWCTDGLCGRSDELIVDPATEQVTHLIVKEGRDPYLERLVPVERVANTSPGRVNLNCSAAQLGRMEHFVDRQYIPMWSAGSFTMIAEPNIMVLSQERVPQGEIAIHHGAHVEAADGHVGQVDGLLIDPASEHITHLVLREGHLWGQKDVTIPVSEIARIEADRIYLKLDRRAVGELPTVPIHRRSRASG